MKARLTKYGFTRSFQLQQDLEQQDKLTTWIEYLGYEYWFYDRATNFVGRFQRQHDDAWKELVDSNLLRPGETYEVMCDVETVFKHEKERQQAEKAVQSATMAALSAANSNSKPEHPRFSRPDPRQQQSKAQRNLNLAKEKLGLIKVRDDAITAFLQTIKQYRYEKKEAERYSLLLRWTVQQIPSIELELNSLSSAEGDPDYGDRSGGLRRVRQRYFDKEQASTQRTPPVSPSLARGTYKRSRCNSIDSEQPSKRLKICSQSLAHISTTGAFTPAETLTTDTRTIPDLGSSQVPDIEPFRPRRSARIAERTKNTAVSAKGLLSVVRRPPSGIKSAAGRVHKKSTKKKRKVASPRKI